MVNWLELIEEKEDQILAEGEKAYKEAINNPHLRYIVEIDENGDVYSWYDVAGGNSFHVSTFHWSATRETKDGKTIFFDARKLFK